RGQFVAITYCATTRNESAARSQPQENYEPAIPDVTVYLETPGPDGVPNNDDDVIVNKYVTDHWQQPNASQDPQDNGQGGANSFTQNCNPIRDYNGNDITGQFAAKIGPNCLEVPLTGTQTKEGAFDGGYAFADYCPNGYDLAADNGTCNGGGDPQALAAGTQTPHAGMAKETPHTRQLNPPTPHRRTQVNESHPPQPPHRHRRPAAPPTPPGQGRQPAPTAPSPVVPRAACSAPSVKKTSPSTPATRSPRRSRPPRAPETRMSSTRQR